MKVSETNIQIESRMDLMQPWKNIFSGMKKHIDEAEKTMGITSVSISMEPRTGIGWIKICGMKRVGGIYE